MSLVEADLRINGSVVKWARERLDASLQEAAALSGCAVETIESWENGTAEPTFNQAVNLAHKLGIPFGYLFLSKTPVRTLPVQDLRTVTGEVPRKPSVGLIAVVEDAIRKQHWYSDFLGAEGRLPFVGSFGLNDSAARIAADIRLTLGIDEQLRAETPPTVSAFMTELVRATERRGILVLRSGTVCGNTHKPLSVKEFRGFALPDPVAPMIFINSRDAMVAQIFTWAHEIAHIWINQGGVSLLDLSKRSQEQSNQIEIRCNEIAAEVLAPAANFSHNWNRHLSAEKNIGLLRRLYRVSHLVILRRAFDLGFINNDEFKEGLRKYYEIPLQDKQKKDDESSGGNFYNTLYARNSPRLTFTVAENYAAGNVLPHEACRLLGIKQKALRRIVAST